jgi:hypothetical protein
VSQSEEEWGKVKDVGRGGGNKKKVWGNVRLAYLLPLPLLLPLLLLQQYSYNHDGAKVLSINGRREGGGVLLRQWSQTSDKTIQNYRSLLYKISKSTKSIESNFK